MISLRCEDCLGTMEVDENREVLTCPYCGSKKMLPVSDAVKIEKIKQEAEIEKTRLDDEVKIEKMRLKNEEHERNTSVGGVLIVFLLFVAVLVGILLPQMLG